MAKPQKKGSYKNSPSGMKAFAADGTSGLVTASELDEDIFV
jgi:hypothetical protein